MTETQHIEDRITQALVTIRREWPALRLGPPSSSPGGGAKSARITADDHKRGEWHVLGDSVVDVDAMTCPRLAQELATLRAMPHTTKADLRRRKADHRLWCPCGSGWRPTPHLSREPERTP